MLALTLIFLFIIFYYGIINKFFVSGSNVIFSDWNYFLRGLECKHNNIDIFNKNDCFTFHYGYPIFFIFYFYHKNFGGNHTPPTLPTLSFCQK